LLDFATSSLRIHVISINRFFFKVTRENSTGIGRGPFEYEGIADKPAAH